MNIKDNECKLDTLIKSLAEFTKATKTKKDHLEGHGHMRDGEPMDAANKVEILSKPPVSEAQRKAMHAATSGKSTLGIPKSVGKEFAAEDKGGKLPEKKDKCDKTEAINKSTPIVYYDKEDAVGKAHGTHTLGAVSKVLSQNYDHEKTKDGNHYFRHTYDKNLTAVVFGQRSGPKETHPERRSMDKSEVDLKDNYDYHPKDGPRYHVHEEGMRVTEHNKPLSLKHINSMYGGVKKLESMGFRLVPHEEKDMKKAFEEIFTGEELLSKAEKDELFPVVGSLKETPLAINNNKSDVARSIYYKIKELQDIKSASYNVADNHEDAKPAFEKYYEDVKSELKKLIAEYKKAKDLNKSVEVYSLNESLEKAIIKPKKPSPASAYLTEHKKPEVKVQDPDTAHGLDYKSGSPVKTKPEKVPETAPKPAKMQSPNAPAAQAKVQGQKRDEKLVPSKGPTALETIKEKQKMNKSEIFSKITSEELTKSMRAQHSDEQITEMLKAAFDEGKIHHNTFLEWQNFKTINPCVVDLVIKE